MRDPRPAFGDPVGPWRSWFAWKPVRTFDGVWMWLRRVKRRRIQKHDYLPGGPDFWWQYAMLGDVFTPHPKSSSDRMAEGE